LHGEESISGAFRLLELDNFGTKPITDLRTRVSGSSSGALRVEVTVENLPYEAQARGVAKHIGIEEILNLSQEQGFEARDQRSPDARVILAQETTGMKPGEEGRDGVQGQRRHGLPELGGGRGAFEPVHRHQETPLCG
jgi:hypothetical protein